MENKDLLKHKETWHFFHLCMTFVTFGWWVIVWVVCTICNAIHNSQVDTRKFQLDAALMALQASQQDRA